MIMMAKFYNMFLLKKFALDIRIFIGDIDAYIERLMN